MLLHVLPCFHSVLFSCPFQLLDLLRVHVFALSVGTCLFHPVMRVARTYDPQQNEISHLVRSSFVVERFAKNTNTQHCRPK